MRDTSLIMYVELDVLCALLLFYVALKSFHNMEKRESWRFFQMAVCSSILFVILDLTWELMERRVIPGVPPLPYLINSVYFISSIAGTAFWYFYTEIEMETGLLGTKWVMILAIGPLALLIILLSATYYNGCLFYFDAQGAYQRGPLNILAFLVPCFYLILSVVRSLTRAFQRENYVNKRNYLKLSCFSLIMTAFGVLQIIIPGTPLSCIGTATAVLMVHMTSQELLISQDPLTKLNNRYQMIHYLSYKLNHLSEGMSLHLMLIDLDQFKQINDTYGHVEGDKALIRLASVLQMTVAAFNCFAARYGGDEFILIHETEDEREIPGICQFIQTELEKSNRLANAGYTLKASIGCAKYRQDIRYVPEFIALADEALYEAKRLKRTQ